MRTKGAGNRAVAEDHRPILLDTRPKGQKLIVSDAENVVPTSYRLKYTRCCGPRSWNSL